MANKVEAESLHFPVTPDWCERVREAIAKSDKVAGLRRGGHARLSEALGCSSGHLTDLLKGRYDTSPLVAAVHDYFGWEPPLPPTASLDAGEIVHGYMRMTAPQRELLDGAMNILQGASGEQARKALAEMVKAFRSREKANED